MADTAMMSAEEIEKIKKRTAGYRKSAMTVQELHDKLAKFIEEGNGDAMIEVDDGFGGGNCIFKDAKVYVGSANEELYGKWCNIDFQ
jgi:hypothetical protein